MTGAGSASQELRKLWGGEKEVAMDNQIPLLITAGTSKMIAESAILDVRGTSHKSGT
jgi:hypothetical protein